MAGLIEFELCAAFKYPNSSPSRGWWCDGVPALSVAELAPTRFMIFGAAYWAEIRDERFYIAPFEFEYHFRAVGDLAPERVVVRFGTLDAASEIAKINTGRHVELIVRHRPTRDSEWAFAIELT